VGLYAGTKKVLARPHHHHALIARWPYYPARRVSRCPLYLYLVLRAKGLAEISDGPESVFRKFLVYKQYTLEILVEENKRRELQAPSFRCSLVFPILQEQFVDLSPI